MLHLVSYVNETERARREVRNESAARRLAASVFSFCLRHGTTTTFQLVDAEGKVLAQAKPRGALLRWRRAPDQLLASNTLIALTA